MTTGRTGTPGSGAGMSRPSSRQEHTSPFNDSPQQPSGISPAPSETAAAEVELSFEPDDPKNPRNWSEWKKWRITLAILLIDFTVSWGASAYSPATAEMEELFGVSAEVGTLGLSLYVLGLVFGPMSLAPLSEVCRRGTIL